MKLYVGNSYYLEIVPDSPNNVRTFVAETLAPFAHSALEYWDVSRWGFLCWSDVHGFCAAENLKTTQSVLEFNEGQIWWATLLGLGYSTSADEELVTPSVW